MCVVSRESPVGISSRTPIYAHRIALCVIWASQPDRPPRTADNVMRHIQTRPRALRLQATQQNQAQACKFAQRRTLRTYGPPFTSKLAFGFGFWGSFSRTGGMAPPSPQVGGTSGGPRKIGYRNFKPEGQFATERGSQVRKVAARLGDGLGCSITECRRYVWRSILSLTVNPRMWV